MRDCVKRVVEKTGMDIDQAKRLVSDIDNKAKRMAQAGIDAEDAIAEVVAERVDIVKKNVAKERANAARNVLISAELESKLSNLIDQGFKIQDAVQADVEGANTTADGARNSLQYTQYGVGSTYMQELTSGLAKDNLLQVFNSKAMSDDIGKELWNKSMKEGRATNNKAAQEIADIIHGIKEKQRKRLNNSGAEIGEVAGNVMPQRHDASKMHRTGKEDWVNFMEPLLDRNRTFDGEYKDLREALGAAYDAMITGIRMNDNITDAKLFQFSGPANLAKRLSRSRELHFKDYDSWKKWNDNFGMRDLNDGVIDSIAFDSDYIALLERYGTNPEAMIVNTVKRVKEKYRAKISETNEKGIDKKVQDIVDNALGKNMIPVNPTLAQISGNIGMFNNTTFLGGAMLASIADIPMRSLEYSFQGKGWLESTFQSITDLGALFKSRKDTQEYMDFWGIFSESFVADMGGRFSPNDDLGRKGVKLQRLFFKANGLSWWTDRGKFAMYRVMSNHLARRKGVKYSELDADTLRMFKQYDIGEADWDTIRKTATKLKDGREYVGAEKIKDVKVAEKLTAYFRDRADAGVLTPGMREQRITTFGTQRGTPIGEFTRRAMQFKSFPITVITKVWGRAAYGKGEADVAAMAYLALMSTVFGYIAMTAKDIAKNRTPKDPSKLETIYAAMAQGGGLGVLESVLLQDGTGFGRSLSAVIAGPTVGRLDEVFKIYSASVRGDIPEAQALRFATGMIPGNNLPYIRMPADQMFLLNIKEMVSPGYLRKMERNMNKTFGQEILFQD